MKISIILPTYNERENIITLIKEIKNNMSKLRLDYEIIVVDDNSPDGTGEVVKQLTEKNKEIKCKIRYNKKGLSSAIKEGIEEASGELIVIMDTDLSHPPSTILELFENINDNDIVIASRYIKNGTMDASWSRYFGSMILNKAIDVILNLNVKDSTGGFLIFKKKILENLDTNKIFRGYGEFCFRLLYLLKRNNKRIKEIPFKYAARPYGKSKTNFLKTGFGYLYEAFKLRFSL